MGKTGPVGPQGQPGRPGPEGLRGIPGPSVSTLSESEDHTLTIIRTFQHQVLFVCIVSAYSEMIFDSHVYFLG